MKKLVLSLVLCVLALCAYAQEHLFFKGISIEGSMTSFCQKLRAKGFTELGRDNNITLFTGDVTGRQATIDVGSTEDVKNVHSLVVFFDACREWNTLVNTYDYYKDIYTLKYGNPSVSKENNPARSKSNTAFMAEVHQGTVVYGNAWESMEAPLNNLSKNLREFMKVS